MTALPNALASSFSYSTLVNDNENPFILTVAKQNNLILAGDNACTTLDRLQRYGHKVRSLDVTDMNFSVAKITRLAEFFPRLNMINVQRSYFDDTLICSRDDVVQYFPSPSRIMVLGIFLNRTTFFELQGVR